MMSLDDMRLLYLISCFALCIIIALPTITMFVSLPSEESFSELWLLGEDHMAENYPFNVGTGESDSVFVGVGNYMGSSGYYLIYIKFRNQTQPIPNLSNGNSSSLFPLYEYRFFLADGETWESPVTFAFNNVTLQDDSMIVDIVSINQVDFPVDCLSTWDSENKGFYYQVFFELWLYNTTTQEFRFHNRIVSLWLNMTA